MCSHLNTDTLLIIGLSFNVVGSLILLVPSFKKPRLSDGEIVDGKSDPPGSKKEDPKYETKGHLRERRRSLWAALFLLIGFAIQIIATVKQK